MTCPQIPLHVEIILNPNNTLLSFSFERTGGRETNKALRDYCKGKSLPEILNFDYFQIVKVLKINGEEALFLLHIELEALKCGLAKYIGEENPLIDTDRCFIEEIEHTKKGSKVSILLLPPQNLPQLNKN